MQKNHENVIVKVHAIEPQKVISAVSRRLASMANFHKTSKSAAADLCLRYEQDMTSGNSNRWSRKPESPEALTTIHLKQCAIERDYYAKVQIIETNEIGPRYYLTYENQIVGDCKRAKCTGPFDSIELAERWFTSGGR